MAELLQTRCPSCCPNQSTEGWQCCWLGTACCQDRSGTLWLCGLPCHLVSRGLPPVTMTVLLTVDNSMLPPCCYHVHVALPRKSIWWHGLLEHLTDDTTESTENDLTFPVVVSLDVECIQKFIISMFRQLYGTRSWFEYADDLKGNTLLATFHVVSIRAAFNLTNREIIEQLHFTLLANARQKYLTTTTIFQYKITTNKQWVSE